MKDYSKWYIWLTIISVITCFFTILITSGEYVNRYFFADTLDTGMDYFNSVLYTKTKHPYTQYGTIYPPLANLFYWLIRKCVPENIVELWPDTFIEGVGIRGTSVDLRLSQVLMLSFIVFIILVSVSFVMIVSYLYKDARLGMYMGIAFLFSYGSLTALERGNLIVLTVAFLFIFLVFYDSEKKMLQEVALISLAVSAGLKLYPAFFGIILIADKEWKKAIRTVVYGVLLFILPFILFDGIDGFKDFISSLFEFASKDTALSLSGFKLDKILQSVISQISLVFGNSIIETNLAFSVIKYIVVFLLIISIFIEKDKWKQVLCIGLIVINIQNSLNYTLLFLLPSLMLFCKNASYERRNYVYFVLLSLISLPLPLFYYIEIFKLDLIIFVKQYIMLVLHIYLIVDVLRNFWVMVGHKKWWIKNR